MKILLVGYGKLGQAIEKAAIERKHEIVGAITSKNTSEMEALAASADVVIENTAPQVVVHNIEKIAKIGTPIVTGTTGWYDHFDLAKKAIEDHNGALLTATNFSIGVNLFFEMNKIMSKMMASQPDYKVEIDEIHHIHKLDAPSGTAITTAEKVLEGNKNLEQWVFESEHPTSKDINIQSFREGEVPGTHITKYTSSIDEISLKHEAFNRKGFALGAVLAAEFIVGKKGIFTMSDLFKI